MKFGALALAVMAMTFTSCEKDAADAIETDQAELTVEEITQASSARTAVTDQKILDKIIHLGLDSGKVTLGDFHLPDGSVQERIYIGNDLIITEKELDQIMEVDGATRQFRTNNLVTGNNRTIDIIGYSGNDQFGLSSKAQLGLEWAVNNYNRLNGSALRFNLTTGVNFDASDIVVYDNTANNPGSQGGVAGFPSNGRPFKFVQIYGLESFDTNVNEHVITHEIGHSIGFRHSDYYDRASCGQTGEGVGPNGAIQLPGTPRRDLNSIMQACFPGNASGEFSNNDITALNSMY